MVFFTALGWDPNHLSCFGATGITGILFATGTAFTLTVGMAGFFAGCGFTDTTGLG